MKEVLLFSSGLDSMIAWYYLKFPPCLHISGHSVYSDIEYNRVRYFRDTHLKMMLKIIDSQLWLRSFEGGDRDIPARNLFFVDIAAHYGDIIYLVAQRGEQSIPDRSDRFFKETSELLSYLYRTEKKVSPVFPDMTKQDMIGWYLQNKHPIIDLLGTYSCESPEEGRCGACKMCARTAIALDYNGVLPNDFFKNDIWKWSGWESYIIKLKNKIYEKRRTEQTKMVLMNRGVWYED